MICNWKQHFDIQRFAAAGTQTTGTSTLSAEMKTFYDKTLLDNAEPQLVHDQFGQERNIPAHGGKTIEFRKFSSLAKATTALTEGVTPDGKSLTVTSKTATVAQYGDYIVQSDMLELTAIDNTIVEATRLLGDQAGRTLDTVTREVLAGGTNVLSQDCHGRHRNRRDGPRQPGRDLPFDREAGVPRGGDLEGRQRAQDQRRLCSDHSPVCGL